MNIEPKRISDSMVETVHIVRPNHLNGANRLFGGTLIQWLDEVAGIVASDTLWQMSQPLLSTICAS